MRLFKPMEHIQAAARASIAASPHRGEQITVIARQLSYAGYLSYDMIVWVSHSSWLFHFHPRDPFQMDSRQSTNLVALGK
jgi:peroxin-11B